MGCLDCIMGIIKYLVFVFNVIFAVAGIALLIVGIIFTIDFSDLSDSIDQPSIEAFPILTICIGAGIFIIALFGCCGAIKENRFLLLIYGLILVVAFILQVGLGIWALLEIDDEAQLKVDVRDDLMDIFEDYYTDGDAAKAFDLLQESFECCGVDSKSDWMIIHNKPAPDSCGTATDGCASVVSNAIIDNVNVIGIVTIVLSLTELAAAIFTFGLRSHIKS